MLLLRHRNNYVCSFCKQLGARLNYLHEGSDEEIEFHNATLHIHTPFVSLPRLDVNAGLEIEENVYRINFTLATNSTNISVSGSGEVNISALRHGACPLSALSDL